MPSFTDHNGDSGSELPGGLSSRTVHLIYSIFLNLAPLSAFSVCGSAGTLSRVLSVLVLTVPATIIFSSLFFSFFFLYCFSLLK